MLGLVTSYRYDKELVDMDVANLEADRLHEAIKTKELAHDDVVYILSTRNFHQLRTTFECYRKKYGNPIDKVLLTYITIMQSTYIISLFLFDFFGFVSLRRSSFGRTS